MTKKKSVPIQPIEAVEFALTDWAAAQTQALSQPPSEAFLVRARQAARHAESLRNLESATHKIGFRAIPLPDYIIHVAQVAGVNLGRVLWPNAPAETPASLWIQLANGIGMARQQIQLLVRIWVMDSRASTDENLVFTRGGQSSQLPAREKAPIATDAIAAARILARIESSYDAETRARLDACLAEIEQ